MSNNLQKLREVLGEMIVNTDLRKEALERIERAGERRARTRRYLSPV